MRKMVPESCSLVSSCLCVISDAASLTFPDVFYLCLRLALVERWLLAFQNLCDLSPQIYQVKLRYMTSCASGSPYQVPSVFPETIEATEASYGNSRLESYI